MAQQQPRMRKTNQVRIIGGEWRSRRLHFPAVAGLRPTPDRTRETLFNWLQGQVAGKRCLDLFAGSGALGLEALSRGAVHVVLVEKHPQAARALQANLQTLGAQERATVVQDDALRYLQREAMPFDLVFLDPPFRQDRVPAVLDALLARNLLLPTTVLYVEQEVAAAADFAAWGLTVHRTATAGQSRSFLLYINKN